ncbi:hypothetical protein J3F83DRAFT_236424 [Trichoderma novae-zelandiae]
MPATSKHGRCFSSSSSSIFSRSDHPRAVVRLLLARRLRRSPRLTSHKACASSVLSLFLLGYPRRRGYPPASPPGITSRAQLDQLGRKQRPRPRARSARTVPLLRRAGMRPSSYRAQCARAAREAVPLKAKLSFRCLHPVGFRPDIAANQSSSTRPASTALHGRCLFWSTCPVPGSRVAGTHQVREHPPSNSYGAETELLRRLHLAWTVRLPPSESDVDATVPPCCAPFD